MSECRAVFDCAAHHDQQARSQHNFVLTDGFGTVPLPYVTASSTRKHMVDSDRPQTSAVFIVSAGTAPNRPCQTSSACRMTPLQGILWLRCCLLAWSVASLSHQISTLQCLCAVSPEICTLHCSKHRDGMEWNGMEWHGMELKFTGMK